MTENNGILVFLGCLILAAALVFSGRSWTDLLLRYGQSCWINSSTICAVASLAKAWMLWRRLTRRRESNNTTHTPAAIAAANVAALSGPSFIKLEAVLHKKRRNFPWTWGPLLVVLEGAEVLYYHGPDRGSRLKRRIALDNCTVKGPDHGVIFKLCLSDKTLTFRADSPSQASQWAEALRQNQHSFHVQRWRKRVHESGCLP